MSVPGTQGQPDDATVDLLVKQVTEGLTPAEQRALDVLDGAVASALVRDLERAVAAVALAGSAHPEALPAALADRLTRQAAAHFAGVRAGVSRPPQASAGASVVDLNSARTPPASPVRSRSATYGWLAAAACLVLAVFGWVRSPAPLPRVAQVLAPPTVIVAPPAVVVPTAQEARATLMARADTLKIALAATKDPAAAGVSGDVVWDETAQRGFLHIAGLPVNDPTKRQYQLWIFDAGRDKRYPVDSGVFDIPANAGEVVIPIRAALMVSKPAAFAVTIEKAGGVVVSGREHIVALGAAG
jgi:Anti-sigma-K factor rskA